MGKRAKKRSGQDGPGLPRNVRETFERGAAIVEELQRGVTLEDALARRHRELRELLAPFDAVHLLGQLLFSEVPLDPETYRESEHVGAAYVVELVAAEFLLRPSRAGTAAVTPAIDAHILGHVRSLCGEAALLETWRRSQVAGGYATAESAARGRAASHHLMIRAPGWPWQEHETLRGLFGQNRFAAKLKSMLGFDVEDAIACSDAVGSLAHGRLEGHMRSARETVGDFGEEHPAYRWASETLQGWQHAGAEELRAMTMTALWALNHLGDAVVFDAAAIASAAGVAPAAAAGFLGALSLPFGQSEDDWFRLAEAVRLHPLIDVGDGGFLPTVAGNDLWALRGVLERALADDRAYSAHRGRWLEQRAAELLSGPLTPDSVHLSVDYGYEDDDGTRVEGEIDALLLCGDTAIVIEAKGATMRPGARRGGEAFIKHLRDNVTKAAEQGTQAKRALATPGSLCKNGAPIELPRVREVHPVVVTLDDLSSAAPVLWELQGTRVMPAGVTIPWLVTLHELDLVARTIEWPVQFIHFLRRRSRLNQLGYLAASDELDWWMHYLLVGLYFEDDETQGRTRLLSHTDPLDAWVLYDQGMRHTPAPKPAMQVDKHTRAFLDVVCDERPPGWVPGACMLLDADSKARKQLWKAIDKLRPRARQRGRPQRCTLGFGSAPDPMMICAAVVPNDEAAYVQEAIAELVDARIHEYGEQRVLGIGTRVGSRRPYETLVVVDRVWWELPDGGSAEAAAEGGS